MFEEFGLKNLGNYHGLYVQSDTLLLADVLKNFRNKCIEIYELDPAHFLSAPGLAWQACLKKTRVELELLTDIDMLLMVEKGICHAIHWCPKANNKYMENYDKNIITTYHRVFRCKRFVPMGNISKLPINGFKWVKKISEFDDCFIKNYDENSNKGYFFEVDINYPTYLFNLHKDLPFLPGRKNLKNVISLFVTYDQENYVVHIRALKKTLNHGLILKRYKE